MFSLWLSGRKPGISEEGFFVDALLVAHEFAISAIRCENGGHVASRQASPDSQSSRTWLSSLQKGDGGRGRGVGVGG